MKSLALFLVSATLSSATKLKDKDDCVPTFDLVILQDVTSSMQPLLGNLRDQLPTFAQKLSDVYPKSRIGVGFFGDKPEESGDYCYSTQAALSQDVSLAVKKLEEAEAYGGGEWQENQLGAMMRAVISPKMRWQHVYRRTEHRDRDAEDSDSDDDEDHHHDHNHHHDVNNTKHYKKMILIVTNAAANEPPHWEKYCEAQEWWWFSSLKCEGPSELAKDPKYLDKDENRGCESREYPSWSDWGKLMKEERVLPLFVTGSSARFSEHRKLMCDFAKRLGRSDCFGFDTDRKNCLSTYYTEYAKSVGVGSKSVQYDGEIEDLWNLVVNELEAVAEEVCHPTKPPVSTTTKTASTTTTSEAPATVATTCPPVTCPQVTCPQCECPPVECPTPRPCPPNAIPPKCCRRKQQIPDFWRV